MKIEFHPEATLELLDAAEWYLGQSPQAARDFALAIDQSLTRMIADPGRFGRVGQRCRACSVTRFPFQIVFETDGQRVRVIAIAHAKRRPNYWRRRR